jgi:hypothetical protein
MTDYSPLAENLTLVPISATEDDTWSELYVVYRILEDLQPGIGQIYIDRYSSLNTVDPGTLLIFMQGAIYNPLTSYALPALNMAAQTTANAIQVSGGEFKSTLISGLKTAIGQLPYGSSITSILKNLVTFLGGQVSITNPSQFDSDIQIANLDSDSQNYDSSITALSDVSFVSSIAPIDLQNSSQITLQGSGGPIDGGGQNLAVQAGTFVLANADLTDIADFIDSGQVQLDPSTLSVETLSGSGLVVIGARSTLSIDQGTGFAGTIVFDGSGASLELTGSAAVNGITGFISGFTFGDTINLVGGYVASSATLGPGNVLTILGVLDPSGDYDGTIKLQLDPSQSFNNMDFITSYDDIDHGTDVTVEQMATTSGDTTVTLTGTSHGATYSAGVEFTPDTIVFPAIRTDSPLPTSVPVVVSYVQKNPDPHSDNAVIVSSYESGPFAIPTTATVSSINPTATLDVAVLTGTGYATLQAGNYTNQLLPLVPDYAGYEGILVSTTFDLNVSIKIYAPADPAFFLNGTPTFSVDAGTIHVGQSVTVDVGIGNVATGDLTDTLSSSVGSLGEFSALTNVSDIDAGAAGNVTVGLTGDVAGPVSVDGAALLDLVSHDSDQPDEAVAGDGLSLYGEVLNYADPVFAEDNVGFYGETLTRQDANDWTLDLGTAGFRSFKLVLAGMDILNVAPDPYSDGLTGSVSLSASPDGGFINSVGGSVDEPLGYAAAGNFMILGDIQIDTTVLGAHTETLTFDPLSVDSAGTTGLSAITLTVTDDVIPPSIPGATITSDGSVVTVSVEAGQDAVLDPLVGLGGIDTLVIEGPGTAEIDGAADLVNLEIAAGGTLNLQGGYIGTDPMTIAADGDVFGYGAITGAETVDGVITASGGVLDLAGDVTGAGTLSFTPGASLLLEGTVDGTEHLIFNAPAETLVLNTGAHVVAPISGFQAGDGINLFIDLVESATYNTIDNTLTVIGTDTGTYTLAFDGDYQQSDFVVADGEVEMACFQAGTRISTERGEVPVEELVIGDLVHANGAGLTPITWIGYRQIDCSRHPRPEHVWPVCVRAHGFAAGRPHRDLWLSPDHAVFVDGMLIPVRQLINGTTIVQVPAGQVTYFHVELAHHDVLTAEGLPVESYLDTGNRAAFANPGASMMLHPDFAVPAAGFKCRDRDACAPFAVRADQVEPVWRRLATRAAELGHSLPAAATDNSITTDAALRLEAGGRVLWPLPGRDGSQLFVVPPGTDAVRLVSRAAAPSASRPWLEDRRRLGVSVGRIKARCGTMLAEVPVDHPALGQGWHDVERAGARMWRWTDGNSYLPIPPGTTTLEIVLAGLAEYPAAESAPFSTRGTVARCSDHSGR